jgi:hypothetical protein
MEKPIIIEAAIAHAMPSRPERVLDGWRCDLFTLIRTLSAKALRTVNAPFDLSAMGLAVMFS